MLHLPMVHMTLSLSPAFISIIRFTSLCVIGSLISMTYLTITAKADDSKSTSLHSTAQLAGLIADANLQRCLENIAFDNHWTEAEQISGRIACKKQGISSLAGIEALTNITSLDISANYISDISPLGKLQRLEVLKMSFNTVSDLRPLLTLKQLKILNIDNNMVTDISALKNLYQLKKLSLQNNLISDVSALSALSELQHLNLAINNITDISALAHLGDLQYLSLLNNDVTDIRALENLSNLQGLHLGGNKIRNLNSLTNLVKLSNLNLSSNGLHSGHSAAIEALAALPVIQHVDLSANQQLSCSALNHLISELKTLNAAVLPEVARDGESCSAP